LFGKRKPEDDVLEPENEEGEEQESGDDGDDGDVDWKAMAEVHRVSRNLSRLIDDDALLDRVVEKVLLGEGTADEKIGILQEVIAGGAKNKPRGAKKDKDGQPVEYTDEDIEGMISALVDRRVEEVLKSKDLSKKDVGVGKISTKKATNVREKERSARKQYFGRVLDRMLESTGLGFRED